MDVAVLPGGHLLKLVSAIFGPIFDVFLQFKSHFLTFVRSGSHFFRSMAIKIKFLVRSRVIKIKFFVRTRTSK